MPQDGWAEGQIPKDPAILSPTSVNKKRLEHQATGSNMEDRTQVGNQRVKYYSALKSGNKHLIKKEELDDLPDNDLNESNYLQYAGDVDEEGKHGPFTNIFSCWNSMVGTGLVTIPWAYAHSGILLGVILTFISFSASFTT